MITIEKDVDIYIEDPLLFTLDNKTHNSFNGIADELEEFCIGWESNLDRDLENHL